MSEHTPRIYGPPWHVTTEDNLVRLWAEGGVLFDFKCHPTHSEQANIVASLEMASRCVNSHADLLIQLRVCIAKMKDYMPKMWGEEIAEAERAIDEAEGKGPSAAKVEKRQ